MNRKFNLFLIPLLALLALGMVLGGCPTEPDDDDDDDKTKTPTLKADIDPALIGAWKDKSTGTTLTITFTDSNVTWGGSSGSAINTATGAYQGSGYTAVWIAKDGQISLKYSYQGVENSYKVYDYTINGSGELELKVSGYTFMTLVKD
jgi:hypothetical protein